MARNKILYMSRPDEKNLAFWWATANDHNEYISRIVKFSRALGKKGRSWVGGVRLLCDLPMLGRSGDYWLCQVALFNK